MTYKEFILSYRNLIASYWERISLKILYWKNSYQWPQGIYLTEAIAQRDKLEAALQNDLAMKGFITKKVFDDVMQWGFGRPSTNSDEEIQKATKKAFEYLKQEQIVNAALALNRLPGIGISRASKILALSDQSELAIYDSRAAHGMSDLVQNGQKLIPIPPGRIIRGDPLSKEDFCQAFEKYIWVLRFLRDCAQTNKKLCKHFKKVSDLEIAFFAKSRKMLKSPTNYQPPSHIKGAVKLDEGDCYWTLSIGKRAKPFWAYVSEDGIKILTGPEGRTKLFLTNSTIESCLRHFSKAGWFLLGNQIDAVKPNSLGEYFKKILKKSPKFASHFAAIFVTQGRLTCRYGTRNIIELKVVA
jgi:hypothetical protein